MSAPAQTGTEIERFCSNIADAARDRRYVLQTEELQALQQEVDKRIKVLEEKRAEYEDWLKRREEFLAQAEDGVVKIYAGMSPDAAAERLAELDASARRRHPDEARRAQGRRHPQRNGTQGGGDADRRHGKRSAQERPDMNPCLHPASPRRFCLSGCASGAFKEIGQEPALSPVGSGLDQRRRPRPQATTPTRQPPVKRFSLWNDRQSRLFTDPRALSPGDILTVRIKINDRAKFKNESERSRTADRSLGGDLAFDWDGVGDRRQRRRQHRFEDHRPPATARPRVPRTSSCSVAAVVIEVLPNGNLIIKGSQEVRVNAELRILTIGGIVRPYDIGPENTISYERIAEARISYGGRGRLTEVQQPPYGQQILDRVLPF